MNIPNIFQPFIAATEEAFAYLIGEYGFQITGQNVLGPEGWVIYESPTTRIIVHYEVGSEPWVEIGRLELYEGKLVQRQAIGLDLLLREYGESLDDEVEVPRDLDAREISEMIWRRAQRLRWYGDDMLRGDFRRLPELYAKAEEELRRREAEFFDEQS